MVYLNKSRKRSFGQSTVEYLLLMAVVIMVFFLFTSRNGIFDRSLTNVFNMTMEGLANTTNTIFNAIP